MRLGNFPLPSRWLAELSVARFCAAWIALAAGPLQAWTVHSIQGRDYVSFSDVQTFYDFTYGTITGDSVKLVKPNQILTAKMGTRELFLNNLCFYLNLPLVREDGLPMLSRLDLAKIIDPVLRPGRIRGGPVRAIVLDPGHGGNDQGTWSPLGTEKFFTLETINRVKSLLEARGFPVFLTRDADAYLSLEDRVQIANHHPNALFVSLHFNAGADTRGIETYALTPLGVPSSDNLISLVDFQVVPGNDLDSENIALATAIHGCIMQRIHLRDRGIRRARFHVLKGLNIPGILIEGGYLGGEDAAAISRADYRQALAESVALGVARYAAAVPDDRWPSAPVKPPLPKPGGLVQALPKTVASDVAQP